MNLLKNQTIVLQITPNQSGKMQLVVDPRGHNAQPSVLAIVAHSRQRVNQALKRLKSIVIVDDRPKFVLMNPCLLETEVDGAVGKLAIILDACKTLLFGSCHNLARSEER